MTRRNLLSDPAVNSKNKAPGYYLDGNGLYLQVGAGGSRSWVLRYKFDKKSREMGLGSVSTFGLAKARERAQQFRQLIADGIDPIEHRKAARAAATAVKQEEQRLNKSFEVCANEYHLAHAENWKNAKHADQWINTLKTYVFPRFGHLPLAEINKQHILQAITPLWNTKAETASRVLQRVRLVCNYAAAKDYGPGFDAEFWEQIKLALGANDKARKVEHHSSCPYQDVPKLLRNVSDSTASDTVKLAFDFCVLTAARSGEVRGATWSELSEDLTTWTIPAERMKAAREHRVPLSPSATALLRIAKGSESKDPASLIFPNGKNKPLSDMVFTQLMRRLELPYTMHGFRASFRTWGMEATTYPDEMLEFALAHVVGDQTVRAYARSDMVAKRRQLMADWDQYITSPSTNKASKEIEID